MFNTPAITWTLTVILLLSGSHHTLQATKSRHPMDQVNQSLHALMHVLMAAMLWNLASSTGLVQIVILAVGALWFIIQSVARPEFKILCTNSRGRIKCFYHSLTMAGAALMIAMMGHMTSPGYERAPSSDGMAGMPMGHNHHAMAVPVETTTSATSSHSPDLAILLTIFFAAAAVVFIILLLRFRATKSIHHNAATATATKFSARIEHGLEALGAAVMALMFATMTA